MVDKLQFVLTESVTRELATKSQRYEGSQSNLRVPLSLGVFVAERTTRAIPSPEFSIGCYFKQRQTEVYRT
jgi:hypothetical protein